MMMDRERFTKQLYWYARYLVFLYMFLLVVYSGIVVYSGNNICYEEELYSDNNNISYVFPQEDTVSSDCIVVSDLSVVEKKYNRYIWVSIVCLLGYLLFLPRERWARFEEKLKRLNGGD